MSLLPSTRDYRVSRPGCPRRPKVSGIFGGFGCRGTKVALGRYASRTRQGRGQDWGGRGGLSLTPRSPGGAVMARVLLLAAVLASLASWVLAPITLVAVHVTAYVLAVVIAMCLVAVSRRLALELTSKTGVPSPSFVVTVMRLVVVAAFLAGVFHSYYIARYFA